MWLKVLLQLRDLAPHLKQLVPLLEKYVLGIQPQQPLQLEGLNEMRGDLDQLSKAHTTLYRQLQDQTLAIVGLEDEIKRLNSALVHSERRVEAIEQQVSALDRWLKIAAGAFGILLVTLVILVALLLHSH